MATPPSALKGSLSSSHARLPSAGRKAFDLRAFAIHSVGHENFKAFELWAFKADKTVIYDDRIVFMWNNAHSSNPVSGEPRTALETIIAKWKELFIDGDNV